MTQTSALLNNLELLVVSNDYATLKMLVRACQEFGSRLDSTPSLTSANDFLRRRKIDGIIIDLQVPGALEFIATVRNSNSNRTRSEEHTSELQSRSDLVCRLLLEKKKKRLAEAMTLLAVMQA